MFPVVCLLIPARAGAEYLFLKDGSFFKGTVIEENLTNVSFKKEEDGTVKTYQQGEILRVLYTELCMEQQYIRLTNGDELNVYVVDEDRANYIVRKELYKPNEIIIPRLKVLSMSRKTPKNLNGTADSLSMKLTWDPPMGTVKEYRVYLRKEGEKYPRKPAATTDRNQCTIEELLSNTNYSVMVTAAYEEGLESNPSNEISLVTKNIPSGAPGKPRCLLVSTWQEGKLKALIEWERAIDNDGTVKEYQIELKGAYTKNYSVAVTPETAKAEKMSYEVTGLDDATQYILKIRAIDNSNAASAFSDELKFDTKNQPPDPVKDGVAIQQKSEDGVGYVLIFTWKPSKDAEGPITGYRIYEITPAGRVLRAQTEKTEYNLPSYARDKVPVYKIYAVDKRDAESKTAEVVKFEGMNEAPEAPPNVMQKEVEKEEEFNKSIEVSWQPAKDPDGSVVLYRVYVKTGLDVYCVGDTKRTEYSVKALDLEKQYSVIITSVDNKNLESTNKPKVTTTAPLPKPRKPRPGRKLKGYTVALAGSFLAPIRDLGGTYGYGFGGGGTLSLRYDRLTKKYFVIGGDIGANYFSANHWLKDYCLMIPLFITAGYSFYVLDFFAIVLEAGVGGAVVLEMKNPQLAKLLAIPERRVYFDPAVSAGIRFEFTLKGRWVVFAGCNYTGLIESKGLLDFITSYAGAGYRW